MDSFFVSVFVAFAAAVALALVFTPLVMRLATVVGAVDQPNERKTHKSVMPRMGGVAVFASFALSILALHFINPGLDSRIWIWNRESRLLGIALVLMLGLGIWDDIKTLGPGKKFLAQLAIASLVYYAGFSIKFISFPNTAGLVELNMLEYAATVVWIIGVTNAVNLIDGLDGLASGVGMIACLTIAPISFLNADPGTAVLAVLLAGGLLGFLRYNFNPAKIFLGDSGSLVLGLALAVLSIRSSTKASTAFAILIPILALGLPIMETLLSMLRRFLKSILPGDEPSTSLASKLRTMFLPDKMHIHHRLIASGFSHRQAVLTLYVVSCVLGGGAFAISVLHNVTASLILIVVGGAAVIGIRQLKYTEMAVLKNGLLLPLYDREFLNRETFQGFLDVFFIVLSFFIAWQLAEWKGPEHILSREFVILLVMVCPVQFTILLLNGLYKGSFRYMGLWEAVRATTGVLQAVAATWLVFAFVAMPPVPVMFGTFVLDFYLLLSCVLGSRISFSILKNLSSKPVVEDGRRVLLYGAGMTGRLILDRINIGTMPGLVAVGFLDDDPYLEGKKIQGFTVFGGHWKLEGLLKRMHIDEVLVVNERLRPEILRRLETITRAQGATLRRLSLTLEEMSPPERVPAARPPAYSGKPVGSFTQKLS